MKLASRFSKIYLQGYKQATIADCDTDNSTKVSEVRAAVGFCGFLCHDKTRMSENAPAV